MDNENSYSAFLAIIGRPNSGKSTLMNAVLGEKLAIVSPMPQTTQKTMRGIYTKENMQIILMDTPGIHKGKHLLNKLLYEQSVSILKDAGIDIICYLVDMSRDFGEEEDDIAQKIEKSKTNSKILVIFNKVDRIAIEKGMKKLEEFNNRYPFLSNAPKLHLSALAENAAEKFIEFVKPFVPQNPMFYPPDEIIDCNMRFMAAECIRKQIIDLTEQEVPHSAFVSILQYKESENLHEITADIHVETSGQKAIIIGENGRMISQIRTNAQKRMRGISGIKTKFSLFVKVTPNWREKKDFLADAGF
ncbi:MAG: GTPase Era [Chitinispirillales bacterium]|nr:GTPase Era [Chitinispirillales bacterium]